MNTVKYDRFDLNRMCKNPLICIIGPPGSGKTTIVIDILKHLNYEHGMVISPDKIYEKVVPKEYIHHHFKNLLINNLVIGQKVKMEMCDEKHINTNTGVYCVLDGCIDTLINNYTDSMVENLLDVGKSYNIANIITLHLPYHYNENEDSRINFDYIFLLRINDNFGIKKIYDLYGSDFCDFPTFRHIFLKLTEDHCAMIIDRKHGEIYWLNVVLNAVSPGRLNAVSPGRLNTVSSGRLNTVSSGRINGISSRKQVDGSIKVSKKSITKKRELKELLLENQTMMNKIMENQIEILRNF